MVSPNCHSKANKDYKFVAIVITLCLLLSCSSQSATTSIKKKVDPTSIATALSSSEKLFAARSDIEKLREAVHELDLARNPDERNFEVEWKFAKYSYFLGKAEQNPDDADKAFDRGKDAGLIASRLEPTKPDGFFWFGANLGELARMSPITVGIKSVDDIRESMNKVVELAPGYQGASAYDALGELEMETRSFKGGSPEKAVGFFEQGLKLSPDNSNIRLHLAEAYLALKHDDKAKSELNTLLTMKPNPEFVAEHQLAVAKGKELLEKNF